MNLISHLRGCVLPDTDPAGLLDDRIAGLVCTCVDKPKQIERIFDDDGDGEDELSTTESHSYYNRWHNRKLARKG